MKRNKKVAFTLAEVLITLGIIGVVAALTLPTLIKSYQKQVWATSAKKSYAVISNMLQKMMADEEASSITDTTLFTNGICVFSVDNSNNCEDTYGNPSILKNVIPKYLKVIKICEDAECNVKYKDLILNDDDELLDDRWGGLVSVKDLTYANGKAYGFYTTDGQIFYFSFGGWADDPSVSKSNASLKICFDTNGEKGPNIRGRDAFCMEYCRNKKGKVTSFVNGSSCWSDPDYGENQNIFPINHLMNNGWKMDY